MTGTPYDWNVIVTGAWNLAILTPQGITTRLFGLPAGTPVEVQVPLDMLAPARVIHDGMMVTPARRLVLVQPMRSSASDLEKAAQIALRGIRSLPETPFSAAGVNIRFGFEALPDSLLSYVESPLDDLLTDAGHSSETSFLRRSIAWRGGLLNFELMRDATGGGTVLFNLHRESAKVDDLVAWLESAPDLLTSVRDLVTSTLKLQVEWEQQG